jgi:hypothetical protein
VRELVEYGFDPRRISVAAATATGAFQFLEGPSRSGLIYARHMPAEDGTGARLGAGIGAAACLAVGLAASIPGSLAAVALSVWPWIGLGGLAGGLLGWMLAVLLGFGIPEKEAEQYAEDVRQGSVLVTVQVEADSAGLLRSILSRFRPHDINDQPPEWAQPGWVSFL